MHLNSYMTAMVMLKSLDGEVVQLADMVKMLTENAPDMLLWQQLDNHSCIALLFLQIGPLNQSLPAIWG